MTHKMKNFILYFTMLSLTSICQPLEAQVGINSSSNLADPSAVLDVLSNSKGFLAPRMTSNERLSIGSPATGLLLFQTDDSPGFRYNDGTPGAPHWTPMPIDITDTLYSEHRIPMDSVGNGQPPFVIDEPGSYYFTKNILSSVLNANGITIDANNVMIDLNGYALQGDPNVNTGDGIHVMAEHSNIVVKNGSIEGWGDDGIDASSAYQTIFRNLKLSDNGMIGVVSDFNSLISNCSAVNNGDEGIKADEGSIIVACTAALNVGNGIQTSQGCLVIRCTSFENTEDGFEISFGSRVEDCTAHNNEAHGFDIGLGGHVISCNAHTNGGNGFDMNNSCFLLNSKSSHNGYCILTGDCANSPGDNNATSFNSFGNGVRASSNCRILNCTFVDNQRVGIRIAFSDGLVSGNLCINNRNVGILNTSSSCLFVNNICKSNGVSPSPDFLGVDGNVLAGNYIFLSTSSYGPIINVQNVGDIKKHE